MAKMQRGIKILQQTVKWYKIRRVGGKLIIIATLGNPKQREVELEWLKLLCFGICRILLPSSIADLDLCLFLGNCPPTLSQT